jgi:hypothetical protein
MGIYNINIIINCSRIGKSVYRNPQDQNYDIMISV